MRMESLGTVLPDGRRLRWSVIQDDLSNARFEFSPGGAGTAENIEFRLVTFTGVDFGGLRFHGFVPAGSTFIECNFTRTIFETVHLGMAQVQRDRRTPIKPKDPRYPETVFRDCDFTEASFNEDNFYIGNVRFERCRFINARLNRMRSSTGEFVDCVFAGKLIEVGFSAQPSKMDVPRIGRNLNEFRGNDFLRAEMYDCGFWGGVDLDAQILPSGPEYARLRRMRDCVVHVWHQVEEWPNEAEREKGLDALRSLLAHRQDDVFMRRKELGAGLHVPLAIRHRIWELLFAADRDPELPPAEAETEADWSR
jgi:hypothetical protein